MEVAPAGILLLFCDRHQLVAGVCGALGTTAGGELAQLTQFGGLPGLFALSAWCVSCFVAFSFCTRAT